MAFVDQATQDSRRRALLMEQSQSNIQQGLNKFGDIAAARQKALLDQGTNEKLMQFKVAQNKREEDKFNLGVKQQEDKNKNDKFKLALEHGHKTGDYSLADSLGPEVFGSSYKPVQSGPVPTKYNTPKEVKPPKVPKAGKTPSVPPESELPGYNQEGDLTVSSKELSDLRTMDASRQSINKSAEELKSSFDSAGYLDRALPWGQKNQKINTLLTDLQLQAKEAAKLGALSGPDMDLVNNLIGSFTGPVDAFKNKEDAKSAIQEVQDVLGRKVQFEAKTRGFNPVSQPVQSNISHPDPAKEARRQELLKKAGK